MTLDAFNELVLGTVAQFLPLLVSLVGISLALTVADWFLDHVWRYKDGR